MDLHIQSCNAVINYCDVTANIDVGTLQSVAVCLLSSQKNSRSVVAALSVCFMYTQFSSYVSFDCACTLFVGMHVGMPRAENPPSKCQKKNLEKEKHPVAMAAAWEKREEKVCLSESSNPALLLVDTAHVESVVRILTCVLDGNSFRQRS